MGFGAWGSGPVSGEQQNCTPSSMCRAALPVDKKARGVSFGIRHKQFGTDSVPGPQYQIGCSTLGVASQKPVHKSEVPLTVVL